MCSTIHSQTLTPDVLSTSAKNINTEGIVLSYTIGQVFHSTLKNNVILTQGFHQNTLFINKNESDENLHIVYLYPNPFTSILNIDFDESNTNNDYLLEIYNSIGDKIFEKSINSNYESINFSKYSKGEYFIKIFFDRNVNKYDVYKVIHL